MSPAAVTLYLGIACQLAIVLAAFFLVRRLVGRNDGVRLRAKR